MGMRRVRYPTHFVVFLLAIALSSLKFGPHTVPDPLPEPVLAVLFLAVVIIVALMGAITAVVAIVGVVRLFKHAAVVCGQVKRSPVGWANTVIPAPHGDRYVEEWMGELAAMADRSVWERSGWLVHLVVIGIPKLAIEHRLPAWLRG
jgi:hypothetical protein